MSPHDDPAETGRWPARRHVHLIRPARKPSCLVVTTREPHPEIGGERIRLAQLMRALAESFEVHVLVVRDPLRTLDGAVAPPYVHSYRTVEVERLRIGRALLRRAFSRLPLQTAAFSARDVRELVLRESRQHDAVFFHMVRLAEVAAVCARERPVGMDYTDAISLNYRGFARLPGVPLWKRLFYTVESRRLAPYEARMSARFALTTVIAERDADEIERNGGRRPLVVPNDVQLGDHPYTPRRPSRSACVLGNFLSDQNRDGVKWLVEAIRPALHDGWALRVVGNAEAPFMAQVRAHPGVQVTGRVPSVAEACADVYLGICPIRAGAGTQNKILEYGALGMPVITSELGAAGIPERFQPFLHVYRDAADCMALMQRLVDDPAPALERAALFRSALERDDVAQRAKRAFVTRFHALSTGVPETEETQTASPWPLMREAAR